MDVACHTSGSFLFGVKEYFPALMAYVDRYGIDLKFQSTLAAVDGAAKTATFKEAAGEITRAFDMIHVTPPQRAPEFVADSTLADPAGYLEIDQTTLPPARYPTIFRLGHSASTPQANTNTEARTCGKG